MGDHPTCTRTEALLLDLGTYYFIALGFLFLVYKTTIIILLFYRVTMKIK